MRLHELPRWRFLAGVALLAGMTVANIVLAVINDSYPLYPAGVGAAAIVLVFYLRQQKDSE